MESVEFNKARAVSNKSFFKSNLKEINDLNIKYLEKQEELLKKIYKTKQGSPI